MTDDAGTSEPTPVRLRDRLFRGPRLGGLMLAVVFFWESLSPTLLPRSIPVQALLTGACTAIGYALGATVSIVIGYFLSRAGRGPLSTGFARRAVWALAIFVVVYGAFVWSDWQNDQRDLVRMPHMAGPATWACCWPVR